VIPLTRAIPERILEVVYDNALYKSTFTYFTLLYLLAYHRASCMQRLGNIIIRIILSQQESFHYDIFMY